MLRLYESLKIAFSMYSRIPMPKSDWSKENMSYVMCFFPCVGAVIGLAFSALFQLKEFAGGSGVLLPDLFWECALLLLPILITGGIHLDGFLDTCDALSSWQPKERRLEILKDSHAGAFAIICCTVYFIAYLGAYSALSARTVGVISMGFVLSRSLSGISVLTFPQAREKGMVKTFEEAAAKKRCRNVLLAFALLVSASMIVFGYIVGVCAVVTALLVFLYYRRMAIRMFGGVTGDLAGWFLQMCELFMALAALLAEAFF